MRGALVATSYGPHTLCATACRSSAMALQHQAAIAPRASHRPRPLHGCAPHDSQAAQRSPQAHARTDLPLQTASRGTGTRADPHKHARGRVLLHGADTGPAQPRTRSTRQRNQLLLQQGDCHASVRLVAGHHGVPKGALNHLSSLPKKPESAHKPLLGTRHFALLRQGRKSSCGTKIHRLRFHRASKLPYRQCPKWAPSK